MNRRQIPLVLRDYTTSVFDVPEKVSCGTIGLEYLLGVLFMAHISGSVVLLYLRLSGVWGSYALAFIPLFALAVEMVLLSGITMVRKALDRSGHTIDTFQTLMVSLMLSTTVVIILLGLFRGNLTSWQAVMPLFLVQVGAILKAAMGQSAHKIFYLLLLALSVAQILALIAKMDFEVPILWRLLFIPMYLMSIMIVMSLFWQFKTVKWYQTPELDDSFVWGIAVKAIIVQTFAIDGFLLAGWLDGNYKLASTLFTFTVVLILLITFTYGRDIGRYVISTASLK